ncbi:MAG: hypothetical protein M3220_10800 [Chloroflexota bacterium]|nr:hypothetical protein [Chloroflexota bacterium]
MLDRLEHDAFAYFLHTVNPDNGLVPDHTGEDVPASIAAVGLALAAYPIGVERGYIARADAAARTLTTLRFFKNSPQGTEPDATGYQGFYYHFLDIETGRRAWKSELSTIDTACLLAGALYAATYFDRDSQDEREIRTLADELYRRANWQWAQNGEPSLTHGWKPESGFLTDRWKGYSEALFVYVLGLGSPTYPLPTESYDAWTSTYTWKNIYDYELLYAGPLFIHHYSHVWIDFRGIQDAYMREKGVDYFENSRRATHVQQQYAIRNPLAFKRYGKDFWGITASDGPGPATLEVDGIQRHFYAYRARGAPYGPDDGTIAPWAAISSLPFAPEIVLPATRHFIEVYPEITDAHGCKATVNPTFPAQSGDPRGWISPRHYGLNQGALIALLENYRSDQLWRLMRRCPYRVEGLRRAGFAGGWLSNPNVSSLARERAT